MSTTARVRLTIDVPAGSTWGPECKLGQVFKQAGEETANAVTQALRARFHGAKIIGEVEVIAVTNSDGSGS
jgi:hypothetical protein